MKVDMRKQFLLASDFDQTLSFNDSGIVLSELLGTSGFVDKVAGLSRLNLVQQGGELAAAHEIGGLRPTCGIPVRFNTGSGCA